MDPTLIVIIALQGLTLVVQFLSHCKQSDCCKGALHFEMDTTKPPEFPDQIIPKKEDVPL